jgi:hypothetical protein
MSAEMHDGEDHDFIACGDIQYTEGKPLQQPTSDLILYFRSGFWMGGDCGNRPLYFKEKFLSQTHRLGLVVQCAAVISSSAGERKTIAVI